MSDKIPIGISACLLGEAVRFDGGHKRLAFAVEQLAPYVRFEPVCPEMAIGLPTPRPALRPVKQAQPWPAMRYSNDAGVDLTEEMRGFSAQRVAALQHLCGYIVCAKSPSCGPSGCGSTAKTARTRVKRRRSVYRRTAAPDAVAAGGRGWTIAGRGTAGKLH